MQDFFNYEKPILCAMVQCKTPEDCIKKIEDSIAEGAEALGIQLCKLERQYRTREILTEIFSACKGLPIYITSYRKGASDGYTDEECADFLLFGLDCGLSVGSMMLCDVIGDLYGRSPYYELAVEESAVRRQKALIDEIHRRGGYVLMSSHTLKDVSTEESVMIAKAHVERGADIIKIVNRAESAASIPNHIAAIQKITAMTDKKLLLLVSGEGQIVRYIGANFGVCMYLCVAYHNELDTKEQPTLARLKPIRENLPF